MGRGASLEAVDVAREQAQLIARAEAESDARAASWTTNLSLTAIAAVLLLAPIPHAPRAVVPAWLAYQLRFVVQRALGASADVVPEAATRVRRTLRTALAAIDELGRCGAPLALIYLGGTAASPLWMLPLGKTFAVPPLTPMRARMEMAVSIFAYVALIVLLLAAGRRADVAFTGLVIVTAFTVHGNDEKELGQRWRLRAERNVLERELNRTHLENDRERIARELHDGVGADVTALLLRLREISAREQHPRAVALAERAQLVLDELRGVVWSLRNEQGTLAELAKLVDATCRRVRGTLRYERTPNVAQGTATVDARIALAVLGVAREIVRATAAAGSARAVRLELRADHGIDLLAEAESANVTLGDARDHARACGGVIDEDHGVVRARFPVRGNGDDIFQIEVPK